MNPPAGSGPSDSTGLVNPANALTLLRVALVPVIGWLLALDGTAARWWAFGLFVFAALTDLVDGWVARRQLGITRWGQLADPAADKLLIVGTLALVAWQDPALPWWAVAVIAVREVAVTVQRQNLLRRDVVMPASTFGKAKTVSQAVTVSLYLVPGTPHPVEVVALTVALVVTVGSGLEYALVRRGESAR